MNGNLFRAYVERVLLPTLSPGDIAIMENLPAGNDAAARDTIEAAGYDPD